MQSDLGASHSTNKSVDETLFYGSEDSEALRSDSTDALADLELYCPQMAFHLALKGLRVKMYHLSRLSTIFIFHFDNYNCINYYFVSHFNLSL